MTVKTFKKDQLKDFVKHLIGQETVIGVKRKENKFAFGELGNADELVLDYDVTLRSPKAFFQPPKEKIVEFKIDKKTELKTTYEAKPFVLFGVHTYDLKAINQMDKIWASDNPDEHYLSRRNSATIVAIEPTRASKWSFWASMDAASVKSGYDLLLTDIGDKYTVEVHTEKGKTLIHKHAHDAADATQSDIDARNKFRENIQNLCKADRKINAAANEITELVRKNYKHQIWEDQAKKCYSCGSCNLVCPTCYCFDVQDDIELDLKHGSRSRIWDGCLLDGFAYVGSGENFREHRADRFRHRILRKTVFVPDKIGELACVGCGRCSEACLPDITDPVYLINKLKEGK